MDRSRVLAAGEILGEEVLAVPQWAELTFSGVILVGALAFILRGARGPAGPARTWSDLNDYRVEGQMWAVALLSGMAIGELSTSLGAELIGATPLALAVGVISGWSRQPNRLNTLVPGTLGAFASVVGSLAYVGGGTTASEMAFRGGLVFALGLLFVLSGLVRVHPLNGLTWFAALDVVVFLTGPAGESWSVVTGWPVGALLLASIGIAVLFAITAEVGISLAAIGVVLIQLVGAGFGYLPGSFVHGVGPIFVALLGYGAARILRRRVRA